MIEMIWFQRQGNLGSSGMFRARAHPRLQAIAQGSLKASFERRSVTKEYRAIAAFTMLINFL